MPIPYQKQLPLPAHFPTPAPSESECESEFDKCALTPLTCSGRSQRGNRPGVMQAVVDLSPRLGHCTGHLGKGYGCGCGCGSRSGGGEWLNFVVFAISLAEPCNAQLTAAFSSLAKSTLTVFFFRSGGPAGNAQSVGNPVPPHISVFCYFWWWFCGPFKLVYMTACNGFSQLPRPLPSPSRSPFVAVFSGVQGQLCFRM